MRLFGKNILLFLLGGIIYYLIEILWKGSSHWSMIIVGGIAFILIGAINEYLKWETPLCKQAAIATIFILNIEFLSGVIINIYFGLNVWDYSHLPFNLFGQICLPYAILWYLLSFVAIVVDDLFRWLLFGEEMKSYKII